MGMEQGVRKNNFGFIRLLGAVMVITGHMYVLTGQNAPMFMWETIHGFGVASFFVIGGYLITKSWMRCPVFKQYILKRIFRIFPALIVWVLLTVFVIGPLLTSLSIKEYFGHPLTWKYILNCVLYINHLLPGVFENNIGSKAVNGSLWCLPVEFLMYLIIPIYINIGKKLSDKMQRLYYGGSTIAVVVARIVWDTCFQNGSGLWVEANYLNQFIIGACTSTLRIIPYFFMGSLFASCRLEKYLSTQAAIAIVFIMSGLAYLSDLSCYVGQYICISYVVLSLALAEKPIFAAFNEKDISYGMFLSGHVIQQSWIHMFIRKGYAIDIGLLFILSIFSSIVIGFYTEKFIEKPAGKISNRIIGKMENGR